MKIPDTIMKIETAKYKYKYLKLTKVTATTTKVTMENLEEIVDRSIIDMLNGFGGNEWRVICVFKDGDEFIMEKPE